MSQLKTNSITNIGNQGDDNITLNSDGSTDFNGDITADNLPTNGSIVGYQQGVWTPSASRGTVTGIDCAWTRIGNSVTLYGLIADFTDSTANPLGLGGTPYPFAPVTQGRTIGTAMYVEAQLETNAPFSQIVYGIADNALGFYACTNGGTFARMEYANIASLAGFQMFITATYITDDTTWTPQNGATVS